MLTHGHDDHIGDAAQIAKTTGAQIISNFEVCMYLNAQGAENINPGNTGGTIDCGAFSVSLTQALHSSGTVVNGQSIYLGNPNGIVIKARDAPCLYHMGDTDVFSDMGLIAEIHSPKIGLVPVGDRFTMSGRTAALAVKRFFKFETVVPCHYGTFDLLDPGRQPIRRGDARPSGKSCRSPRRRGLGVLTTAPCVWRGQAETKNARELKHDLPKACGHYWVRIDAHT